MSREFMSNNRENGNTPSDVNLINRLRAEGKANGHDFQRDQTKRVGERSKEVIPGVTVDFSETGIDPDAANTYHPILSKALTGRFEEIVPAQTYGERLDGRDEKYAEVGKPGYKAGVLEHSNPDAIAAFDKEVQRFNSNLSRIKETNDVGAVEEFVARIERVKTTLGDEEQQNGQEPEH